MLLLVHLSLLIGVEFGSFGWIDRLYDFGLLLALVPTVAVAGGRLWPWAVVLAITLVPIAGKTFRALVVEEAALPQWVGIVVFLILPAIASIGAGCWIRSRDPNWMTEQELGTGPEGRESRPSSEAARTVPSANSHAQAPPREWDNDRNAGRWIGALLGFEVLMYLGLNQAFFRFPWPWREWTTRTPNALVFSLCALVLIIGAWKWGRSRPVCA